MQRRCRSTEIEFSISGLEQEYCRRNDLPLPVLAPAERLRNMLIFRNRTYLYNGTCAVSGKKMLTCFPPGSGCRACDVDVWRSDRIDNRQVGRDYDSGRPFFSQMLDLYHAAYLPGLTANRATMENCDYGDGIEYAKNCYLIFASSYVQDCMFCYLVRRCRDLLDCVYCFDSELCYECADVRNCFNLKWSRHCENCSDSSFLFNCTSCSDCYCCTNLAHKKHCLNNKQLSEKEYFRRVHALALDRRDVVAEEKRRFANFSSTASVKYFRGVNIENCSGDFLYNSKNCEHCFFVSNSEDCADCLELDGAKQAILQAYFGFNSELVYNSLLAGANAYNLRFCQECWTNVAELEYCMQCSNGVEQCFGCVGLTRASYCILNKQYRKNEYFELIKQIKAQMSANGEYGHFFPAAFSPFYYNESTAQMFYPLLREDALKRGFRWHDSETEEQSAASCPPDGLPANEEEVLNKAFACRETGKAYRFVRPELQFYRRQHLPLPDCAPMERIRARLGFYNLTQLTDRPCSSCSAPLRTSCAENTRRVLCGDCFRREVY